DGGGNDGGAVPVAGVVLHDQHRAHTPLLAAHHGTQVGIEDISSFYAVIHSSSHSAVDSHRRHKAAGLCNTGHYDSPTGRRDLYAFFQNSGSGPPPAAGPVRFPPGHFMRRRGGGFTPQDRS